MGEELGFSNSSSSFSSATTPINSSNIGFQLLKKHGWEEGTGLGVSQQGRLEPVQAHVKNNKRGLGADRPKKKAAPRPPKSHPSNDPNDSEHLPLRKPKALSRKIRKMQELEKQSQEKEFERAFYREFWPDNV